MQRSHHFESGRTTIWRVLRQKQTYDVFLVCLSSGSNNISIYIPLFASLSVVDTLVVIPVLYGYIASWLFLSFILTRAPGLALVLNRYAPLFFPFILIWLGCRILVDTGAFSLLIP
ncbi:MAG: cadmium resistance transporter [Cyanobacteriota bacterium]